MPAGGYSLNAADAERLSSCLEAIVDESNPGRWTALDQLRYFCDGANSGLLEAIGGKRFNTLQVLLRLLEASEALGGPIEVRRAPELHRTPVGLVLRLLESLLCNSPTNLKHFMKSSNGIRLLLAIVDHQEALVHDVEQDGLTLLNRACNVLCSCAFHHPDIAASQLVAVNGVVIVSRLLQCSYAHYSRTLARPGTALPYRPPPQGPSAQWDSLTGDVCELISNVCSSDSSVQKLFVQNGALRTLIDLTPLLTAGRVLTAATTQPSLSFLTEQVLLAASTLIWCDSHACSVARRPTSQACR